MTASNNYDQELSNFLCDILNIVTAWLDRKVYNRRFAYYRQSSKSIQKELKSKENYILNNH